MITEQAKQLINHRVLVAAGIRGISDLMVNYISPSGKYVEFKDNLPPYDTFWRPITDVELLEDLGDNIHLPRTSDIPNVSVIYEH